MLESIAANILNRILGSYVENLDPAQLNVGIWSGDVKLKNLRLRKDCLDSLELPIEVKFGVLGQLVLVVPWSSLKNKPVKIIIEDCFLLCTSKDPMEMTYEEILEKELRAKLSKLAEYELSEQAQIAIVDSNETGGDTNASSESFKQSLITKIIDNLQITIKNIHIRYEDTNAIFGNTPYSLGLTLSEVSAVSTDAEWKPSFIEISQSITHKLLTLDSLCCYWDNNNLSLQRNEYEKQFEQFVESFTVSTDAKRSRVSHDYILKPVTGTGRLSFNKLGATEETPKIDFQVIFEEFGVIVDDLTYLNFLHTLSCLRFSKAGLKYREKRPAFSVSHNPRKWFLYVAECVLQEYRDRNDMWKWSRIKQSCNERREYMELWIMKLGLGDKEEKLSAPTDNERLDALHRRLSFDQIVLYRRLARSAYCKAKLENRGTTNEIATHLDKGDKLLPNSQGWLSSWWYGKGEVDNSPEELVLTDEQRQELYSAIEFDENDKYIDTEEVPGEAITLRVSGLLRKGSLAIKKAGITDTFGEILFTDCELEFVNQPDSYTANFKMRDFEVKDGSPSAIYRDIIKTREAVDLSEETNQPLLKIRYESNPAEKIADSNLQLKLRGFTIFYNVHFITEIHKFFSPPNQHKDTIAALISAAEETVEGWTTQTRMGIESLWQDRKILGIDLDLQAPLFILPLDPHSWETPCVVIDAGHLSFASELVPKEKIEELKGLSPEEYNSIDGKEINRLMFDRFLLASHDTQILLGPDIQSTLACVDYSHSVRNYNILEKMEIKLTLDISILPKALQLPKVRIYGNLPSVHISLNDFQYKVMLQILFSSIPSFGETTAEFQESTTISNQISAHETQLQLSDLLKTINSMTEKELSQNLLEVSFDISDARISLYECMNIGDIQSNKLVDVNGKNFKFSLTRNVKEMELGIIVHSLNIEDYIEPGENGEFKNMVSVMTENGEGINSDLFDLSYKRTQRIVSHKDTLIEVFDQDIRMHLSKLQLILTPRSILTLINYFMKLITDPEAPDMPQSALNHNKEDGEDSPQTINFVIFMEGSNIVFNDETSRIGTLVLAKGELHVLLLPQKMRVDLKSEGFELFDDFQTNYDKDSVFRKLISMNGKELFDLKYETFDPETNDRDYDSLLRYSTGSMQVNFIEDSVNRYVNYFYKFSQMKTLFDRARQIAYNQVPSMDTVNNMKMEILVRAPEIRFPKSSLMSFENVDSLNVYLGELSVNNYFVDTGRSTKANKIDFDVRNTRITSIFNYANGVGQSLDIVDDLGLHIDLVHDSTPLTDDAIFNVSGKFDKIGVALTDMQLRYLIILMEDIGKAFTISDHSESLVIAAQKSELSVEPQDFQSTDESISPTDREQTVNQSKSLIFSLHIPEVSLLLYDRTEGKINLNSSAFTMIKVQDMGVTLSINHDGNLEGTAHILSLLIEDIRNMKDNKHTELIKQKAEENFLLTVNYKRDSTEKGLVTSIDSIVNSPYVILAMDYILACKEFWESIWTDNGKLSNGTILASKRSNSENLSVQTFPAKLHYSVEVLDPAIILLADPADINSEAVVFNVERLTLTQQNITSVLVQKIEVSLSTMNRLFESKVHLIDTFSLSLAIEYSASEMAQSFSSILLIEPLIMRLSLRDIRLATMIFNRFVSMLENTHDGSSISLNKDDHSSIISLESSIQSHKSQGIADSVHPKLGVTDSSKRFVKERNESFSCNFGGLRLILIGDVHELPVLDINLGVMDLKATDWTRNLSLVGSTEAYINIFNYSRSSWEPLIEKVPLSLHVNKGVEKNATFIFDFLATKMAELTISARSIAMLSHYTQTLADTNLAPRGAKKPYKIINDSSLSLDIWMVSSGSEEHEKLTVIGAGQIVDWEFEDWESIRENLDTDRKKNILGIKVHGDLYQNSFKVDATSEGEQVFSLKPPINGIHHRIATELICDSENIKIITLRSPYVFENTTHTTLELEVSSTEDKEIVWISVSPSEKKSIPVPLAYSSMVKIRPIIEGENYSWSMSFTWKDLLNGPLSLTCLKEGLDEDDDSFNLEITGIFDQNESLARKYPHMKVLVSPPIVIENCLPCDFEFSVFRKNLNNNVLSSLSQGTSLPLHSVSLRNFLLLVIRPLSGFTRPSKPSIVNTPANSALRPEDEISIQCDDGQHLMLRIHYQMVERSKSKIIKIYAPYVIFNATDRDLFIKGSFTNVAYSKLLLGDDNDRYTVPKMFSFSDFEDKDNRIEVRFKETEWSPPLSIDALGQSYDTSLLVAERDLECNLGIALTEGRGSFLLSKIVEITPRYIIKNNTGIPVEVCEPDSDQVLQFDEGALLPFYKLKTRNKKQIMIKQLGKNTEWTSPLHISEIGLSYVKLSKSDGSHQLIKLDITLEKASLFIRLEDSENNWPYYIKNYTDHEFIFYQRDPKTIDDFYENDSPSQASSMPYEPVYYKLPPRSVMPYAWDYPAAKQKKLVITGRGRRREIDLGEIGNLKPMRLPSRLANEDSAIVDFNVVATGPTQSLIITNYTSVTSGYKIRTQDLASSSSINSSIDGFEADDEDSELHNKYIFKFEGLGISLIDANLQELLYARLSGIELRFTESDLYESLSWKVKWIQVSNQLYSGVYANIIYPTAVSYDEHEVEEHPIFSGSLSKLKDETHGITYYKHMTLLMQELSIQLDEEFLLSLIEFTKIPGVPWNFEGENFKYPMRVKVPDVKSIAFTDNLYFEMLHIQPTILHFSFVTSDHLNGNILREETKSDSNKVLSPEFYTRMLSTTLGNINDAPIKLNSLFMDNVRVPFPVLFKSMKTHYGQQILFQVHKILGSADCFGNPVGLFNTISSGVWDLFYEPYHGYMMNDRPQEIGLHLAKGGLSFVKKTVFGLSDSMSKLTGSVAKGLSITQDKEFQEARRLNQRISKNSRNILSSSAQSFASTVGSGFSGIALDPYKAIQKEGAQGFIKGLGKGLIGLPTKTAIGFLDLTSNLSQGVRTSTNSHDLRIASRARLPRYIDQDKIIKPYNLEESEGQYWLKTASGGVFMEDKYLGHVMLSGNKLTVIVSMEHIVEINITTLEVMWSTAFGTIQGITLEKEGIHIKLKSQSEYFVPIVDAQKRKQMYKNIAIAVKEYNKYCEVVL